MNKANYFLLFEKLHIPKVDYIPIYILKITSSYTGTCSKPKQMKKVDEYNIGKELDMSHLIPPFKSSNPHNNCFHELQTDMIPFATGITDPGR